VGPVDIFIPDDWNHATLGQLFEIIKGENYESKYYSLDTEGYIFLTLKAIKKYGGFNKNGIKYYNGSVSNSSLVSPGDLIIANTDLNRAAEVVGYPIRVPEFDRDRIAISMDVSKLCPVLSDISDEYYYYLLSFDDIHRATDALAEGSTVLHLDLNAFSRLNLPVPPLPEQRRIAEILSTVDELIQQTDAIIEETERLKRGLMQDLLTQGIGHESFRIVQMGPKVIEIPTDWQVSQIRDIANVQYGKSLPESTGRFPAVGSSGIYSSVGESLAEENTIIIGRKGSAGETYLVENESWPSDTTFYLDSLNKAVINTNYLYYFLKHYSLADKIEQTTLPSLDRNLLETYQLLIPSLHEQRRIAGIFSTIDIIIQNEQTNITKLEALKRGLMQDLLTGNVRVPVET
jgi:type I restriction enzyme S subunit